MWKIGFVSFLAALLLFLGLYLRRTEQKNLLDQLLKQTFVPEENRITMPIQLLTRKLSSALQMEQSKHLLLKAGSNISAEAFMLQKIVSAVAMGLLGVVLGFPSYLYCFIIGAAGAILGWLLPEAIIKSMIKKRRAQADSELLQYANNVTTAIDAGLLPHDAIRRVAQNSNGILAQEFKKVYTAIDGGMRKADAFKEMAMRLELQDLNLFIDAILQSEETGTPLTETLYAQAKQIRTAKINKGIERAKKASVNMAFPTLILIFPPLVALLIAPVGLQLGELMSF